MKVVFDTNVILDAAMGRPGCEDSQELVLAVVNEEIAGLVTANTITDIHYIVKKRRGDATAREVVQNTLYVFDVIQVDGESCMEALELPVADYEDAVLAVCAAREEADYIVTRDQAFLTAPSPVPAMTPTDLLRLIEEPDAR